jgi:hypothetical protein
MGNRDQAVTPSPLIHRGNQVECKADGAKVSTRVVQFIAKAKRLGHRWHGWHTSFHTVMSQKDVDFSPANEIETDYQNTSGKVIEKVLPFIPDGGVVGIRTSC